MSGTASRPPVAGELTLLSVHGPAGVVDLTVPTDAPVVEVARAYAGDAGLGLVLPLHTRSGRPLDPSATVGGSGLVSGSVVVAIDPPAPASSPRRASVARRAGRSEPGRLSALWCCLAVGAAVVAAWAATAEPDPDDRVPVVVLLVGVAVLGCLPVGPLTRQRIVAAPAFAAAACFAYLWEPVPEQLPTIVGAAGLAGAVAAALARALNDEGEEALRLWIVAGSGWFVVAALGAITSVPPQVVYAVLLVVVVLAARFVPGVAVDVPDQYLIDVERLAVTAWSARERPSGRRGRFVVPPTVVADVAAHGARMITAASVAVFLVVVTTAPLLLQTATLPLDRIGARTLVGFGGCTLLFAARSYRHVVARRLLRAAGLWCLALVAYVVVGLLGPGSRTLLAIGTIALAAIVLVVAVAVGRGWRSAWWSRRAEVAEVVCGSLAVASVVVAVGLFRHLWELTS